MKRPADEEVLTILRIVRACQDLGVLPEPGGLFAQDALFVFLLDTVLQADHEKQKLDEARRAG